MLRRLVLLTLVLSACDAADEIGKDQPETPTAKGLPVALVGASSQSSSVSAVRALSDGGFVVTGSFQGRLTFGSLGLDGQAEQVYLARFGKDGTPVWLQGYPGDRAHDLAVAADDSVWLLAGRDGLELTHVSKSGQTVAQATLDAATDEARLALGPSELPVVVTAGKGGGSLFALAADLGVAWRRDLTSDGVLSVAGLVPGDDGTIVLGGHFTENLRTSGLPGLGTASHSSDLVLMTVDAGSGEVLAWQRKGSEGDEQMHSFARDELGQLVASGSYTERTDLGGPGLHTTQPSAEFVVRWNLDGSFVWERGGGASDPEQGTASVGDALGNVVVAGSPAELNSVGKLAPDGQLLWTVPLTGSQVRFSALAVLADGSVIVGGSYQGSLSAPGLGELETSLDSAFVLVVSP